MTEDGRRSRRALLLAGVATVVLVGGAVALVVSAEPSPRTTVATDESTTTTSAPQAEPTTTSTAPPATTMPVAPTSGVPRGNPCDDAASAENTAYYSRTIGVSSTRLWTGLAYDTATSIDAGDTWRWRCGALDEVLEGIVPVDDRLAWAYTPTFDEFALYRTSDGGETWQAVPLAQIGWEGRGHVCDIEFPEPRHGFMTIHGDEKAALYRTTDGSTWTVASGLSSAAACAVSFADARHGWSTGYEGRRATLSATSDGGSTWRVVPAPEGARALRSLALAGAGGSGFVVAVSDDDSTSTFLGSTSDGGSTWRRADVPADSVTAIDASTAIAVGIGQGAGPLRMWRTTDGGRTWPEVNHGIAGFEPAGLGSMPLAFSNGRLYMAGMRDSIFISDDLGVTWRRVGIFR